MHHTHTHTQDTSPRSVSPVSVSPMEVSVEAEEPTTTQPTHEELAKAYTEMYSPKIKPGLAGISSYQRVTNPMSLDHPDESEDTVPHVTFAPCPDKYVPLSGVIQVNGDHYRQ